MKKFIYIIIFALISINAYCQEPVYTRQYINNEISFSIDFGVTNSKYLRNKFICAGSFSIFGFYMDIGGMPRLHENDVRIDRWDDYDILGIHGGYKIPVFNFINIIPLVGYYKHNIGVTDGYNWHVNRYNIYNDFYIYDSEEGFDYGGKIEYKFPLHDNMYFMLDCAYTKYMFYGGLGFQIKF